ncbi:MAG: glycoside hydrolase family 57 protein, partial [Bryobacteraceae bacterium]
KLPWTRMHALKDYYGMVRILDEFPQIHQTFNLVPSMLAQIEEYAAGTAEDAFLKCAVKPAEELTEAEQAFVLRYFFQANPQRLIYRYPRYGELHDAWVRSDRDPARARRMFGTQALRDLQLWSQLAWFDEEFQQHDPDVRGLIEKGANFNLDDQALVAQKERGLLGKVLPVYTAAAGRGQIEISATPFYHPILPLLCNSDVAAESHPYLPLPTRFAYPQDARHQLREARQYIETRFQRAPRGLWPSEGSVSDEALSIAAETGFEWAATDNGVLARTLNTAAVPSVTYRPYLWRQGSREMRMLFRDHHLSDLIGFVYARTGADEAAHHFLSQIHDNCRGILAEGRDALVPVILDGENAWEYYEQNGRPFLRELYRRITEDPNMEALTVSEALSRVKPHEIDRVFPGSWINANFDVWIGAEEDNRAWEYLLRARQAYERVASEGTLSETDRKLAYEELLIAEGSDWCWWYGPEHSSDNRPEFDQLYREHLANVYRALHLPAPDELSRPILHLEAGASHQAPGAAIRATVD